MLLFVVIEYHHYGHYGHYDHYNNIPIHHNPHRISPASQPSNTSPFSFSQPLISEFPISSHNILSADASSQHTPLLARKSDLITDTQTTNSTIILRRQGRVRVLGSCT